MQSVNWATAAELRAAIEGLGSRFEEQAIEQAAEQWARRSEEARDALADVVTVNACYLRAKLARPAEAAAAWHSFFALHASPTAWQRLAYARALADSGQNTEAITQLRLALTPPVPYKLFPRAQKLVDRLTPSLPSVRPECPVALLGSSTTQLLAPVVQALGLRDGLRVRLYQGLYGASAQEVLDPASGLHAFRPRVVFLLNHWRDLQLPGITAEPARFIEGVVAEKQALWNRLIADFGCQVVQTAYDYPRMESYAYLASTQPGGRRRVIEELNGALWQAAPAGVAILDAPALQREAGATAWEHPPEWYLFKQHPGTEALPLLAEEMMAHVRATLGLTKKVIALDLDNTLWQGIIGEDGVEGIKLGPGSAAGEAHLDLQRYLLELKQRGIVLAVCSKNNPEDAKLPFQQHPHTALRVDDFAAMETSWDDKAQGLRNLATTLSLGLDSFVFLDDNPMEREWVRSQLPQVTVLEPGPSVFDYVPAIERGRYFFSLSLSAEDLKRAEQYRQESQRETLRRSTQSIDEFIAGLQLQPGCEPVTAGNLARTTQLINKTNQYNLTAQRYTEAEVERIAADPQSWAAVFRLADRLGDYGQIGVILCTNPEPAVWQIEAWLISCRALGRRVERYMFEQLHAAAVARGIRTLRGVYRPNPRNHLVAHHYEQLGFQPLPSGGNEAEACYEFAVGADSSNSG